MTDTQLNYIVLALLPQVLLQVVLVFMLARVMQLLDRILAIGETRDRVLADMKSDTEELKRKTDFALKKLESHSEKEHD